MTSERSVFGDLDAAVDGFEQLPVAVLMVDGPELRLTAYNAMLRATVAGRRHGTPLRQAMPEFDGQGWFEHYDEVVRTGRTISGDGFRVQVAQPDGSLVEIFIDFTIGPWRAPDGSVRGAIAFARDSTERVRAHHRTDGELAALRQQYEQARAATLAMQRALLPDSVPVLPTLQLAARYVLAADEQAAGGDWFDVVARDGRTVLIVGDVVGHGTAAAAAMGQLRAVLLAQLRHGSTLTAALDLLDEYARSVPAAQSATVCVVEIDGVTGDMSYCTAGHPPPLIVLPGRRQARYLTPSGAGPLATGSTFEPAFERLELESMIVLYTDGIIERPDATIGAVSEELRQIARDARANVLMPANAPRNAVDRVCELSIELMTRAAGVGDDITMLAACRIAAAPDLSLAVRADDGLLIAGALRDLRQWLLDHDPSIDAAAGMLHAVTELVDNVVDHAYADDDVGSMTIDARLEPNGDCVVTVADTGSWRDPVHTPGRGLGLALVRRLADALDIAPTSTGTTVTIRKAFTRPAGLLGITAQRVADERHPFDASYVDEVERLLTLRGPVDARSVAELDAQIGLTLASVARPLIVDLSDVTVLASAGVHLLHKAISAIHRAGGEVTLYAPPDTPAQQVLELTATPHVTARAASGG